MTESRSGIDGGGRLVRADSGAEQVAYMLSRFGDPATWSVVSQQIDRATDGRDVEHVEVRILTGDRINVSFVAQDDDLFTDEEPADLTGFLDAVMEAAFAFSRENPPHHPGTIARFPVPSASYAGALALPMPVLAVSDGARGLYAPPRYVVIDFETHVPIGVGEFPGFDPDDWPPPRLGDWPPALLRGQHPLQTQGTIQRFSACWQRVLTAWFDRSDTVHNDLESDIAESLESRRTLDPPDLIACYDRLNPVFAHWLDRHD